MWANSAATRPRLSQTPRRIASIWAGDFFRKGGGEIGTADLVLLEAGTGRSHEGAGDIRHALAAGDANDPQHPDAEPPEQSRRQRS